MIVTGILLFAAVPLVCFAEEDTTNMPPGCMQVSDSSFRLVGCEHTLSTFLGSFCSAIFSWQIKGGRWLGYAASGGPECQVCCVNNSDKNVKYYNVTTAPQNFPCGPGKTCKRGRCS
ncbi:secreted salivary gland peptide, putative [Ixodes scapularis]|uniref:Secreted salivary gland peptide, putative n=1 Tax=Ixodes scapularis TaxID=6945 RepID=B7P9L2_IXOSC|nr:secreted salivary gland peptide, putative [Ixodes scapularis]|eukprot:XP_002404668.1 secreted salivary gland peptide, putative [Ixodes scapularis]